MKKLNTAVPITIAGERSAGAVLANPGAYAEKLNSMGLTDASGNAFTAEGLSEGIDMSDLTSKEGKKRYLKSLRKALSKNPNLAFAVAMETTGGIFMDAKAMSEAAAQGRQFKSDAEYQEFIEKSTPEDRAKLGKILGVDFATANAEQVNQAILWAKENGIQDVIAAKEQKAKKIPHRYNSNHKDGATRYESADGKCNFAIIKRDGKYKVYDYITNERAEFPDVKKLNAFLAELNKGMAENERASLAVESEANAANVAENAKSAESTQGNVGEETADFIEAVSKMLDASKRSKRKKRIAKLSKKHSEIIEGLMKTIDSDFSADGYELWIDGTGAHHIEVRHGNNGEADNSMASKEAKSQIPWATQNADSGLFIRNSDGSIKLSTRFFNADGTRAPEIRLEKRTPDGTFYVSECVPDGKNKRIWITSAYKSNKKGGKGQLLNIGDNSPPQPTSETSFDGNTTTNSIPDSAEKINPSEKNSSENLGEINRKVFKVAKEKVVGYEKLDANSRRAVRGVMRQAIANGFTEDVAADIGSVAARSGAKVTFDYDACRREKEDGTEYYVNAFYLDVTDTITLNPNSAKSMDVLLLHELLHDMYANSGKKGKKAYNKLRKLALSKMSEKEKQDIKDRYIEHGENRESVHEEEITAHYGEEFTNRAFIKALVSEDASIMERIIDFFTKAKDDYAGSEKLSRSAKKFLKTYKKMFDEFSAYNRNNNGYGDVVKYKIADEEDLDGKEERFSFAGKKARTADNLKLETAEKMQKAGIDSETIRKETGWFKGYDGKWRFEINDADSYLIENPKLEKHTEDGEVYFTGKLSDIFNHKELFAAYPDLKNINIVIQKTEFGVDAIYQPNSNYITLSIEQFKRPTKAYYDYANGGRKAEIDSIESSEEYKAYNKLYDDDVIDSMEPTKWLEEEAKAREKFYSSELGKRYYQLMWGKSGFVGDKFEFGWAKAAKETLIHELQHAVQNIEGFAPGTNTRNKDYDRTAGEIEARDAAKRVNMTDEQRKNTRPDIDRTDAIVTKGAQKSFSYIGDTADNRRCYISGFDSSLTMEEKIKLFKDRIATIFNLGAVELKTDVKKIQIKGDRFTSQKNLFGDKSGQTNEYEAKINSLYDLADILATSTYDPNSTSPEKSYVNPNIKPKNAAHKGVKYWYKFKNNIVFDGVPYMVTFNIRDKGKEQYQYLIDFKENKTPGLSNTAVKNLLRADQASYNNSIPIPSEKVKTSGEKNAKKSLEISSERASLPDADVESPTLSNVNKERERYKASPKDKVFTWADNAYISAVDEAFGIHKYIVKCGGVPKSKSSALIQRVRAARAKAETMISSFQYDVITGEELGKGLRQIYADLKDEGYKGKFEDYLLHLLNIDRMTLNERTLAELEKMKAEQDELAKKIKETEKQVDFFKGHNLKEKAKAEKKKIEEFKAKNKELKAKIKNHKVLENKPVFGENEERATAITAEESRKIVEAYEKKHPEFIKIRDELYTFLNNLQDMRVKAGLISAETKNRLAELYPHYVPSMRDTSYGAGSATFGGKNNISVSSTIKSAKGGGQDILSIEESISAQVFEAVEGIEVNRLARAVYDAAVKSGDKAYVIIDGKAENTEEANAQDSEYEKKYSSIELRPKNNSITFFIDGKQKTMQVSKEIFVGLKGLTGSTLDGDIIKRVLSSGNKLFKSTVTTYSPLFGPRNFVRDLQKK